MAPKGEKEVILDIPLILQSENSANCGPCSVKMLFDYYQINTAKGEPYSLHALNRLLDTSHEFGCSEENILGLFNKLQIPYQKITTKQIVETIKNGHPVLASFQDEFLDGHYALIVGFSTQNGELSSFIFQDPWPDFGKHFGRPIKEFYKQLGPYHNWLICLKKTQTQ